MTQKFTISLSAADLAKACPSINDLILSKVDQVMKQSGINPAKMHPTNVTVISDRSKGQNIKVTGEYQENHAINRVNNFNYVEHKMVELIASYPGFEPKEIAFNLLDRLDKNSLDKAIERFKDDFKEDKSNGKD